MNRSALCFLTVSAVVACRTERTDVQVAHADVEPRVVTTAVAVGDARVVGPEVTIRRLWASNYVDFYASSISPDGRYMSMIDWSTVDLAVRDLQTGDVHRLTSTAGFQDGRYQDAGVSVFSRDGRRILYGWQLYPPYVLQLRLQDFELDASGAPVASEPEVLFHNPAVEPYYPFDWSPDGSLIVAKVYTAGNTNALMLISAADGTYGTLRSFDWREPERAAFSPDGRYVAYDVQADTDSPNRDVFVVSVDGTHEIRVADGPAYDRLLGWHPDGSILFGSDRGGTPGIWRILMSDGRPTGPAVQVLADTWGIHPIGFAGDRFYYGVEVDPPRLYTVAVDFASGSLAGAPVMLEQSPRLEARGWDWSPNGRYLAWSAAMPTGSVIVLQSADGEEVRSIPLDLRRTRRLRWHPDGRSIIAHTGDLKGRRGFYRIDLASGSHAPIVHDDALPLTVGGSGIFDLSPDGRTAYFAAESGTGNGARQLVSLDLESGVSVPLTLSVSPDTWLAVSPDGSRLAIVFADSATGRPTIGVLPVAGGEVTALFEPPDRPTGLEWTPDGRMIVFLTSTTDADYFDDVRLWSVPLDGGEARSIALPELVRPQVLSLHPDGRRLTFLAGESRGEVWMMDGLGSSH